MYPQARFDTEGTYNPDRLIAGDRGLLRHEGGDIRVPANTTLKRGTLMGRQFAVRGTPKAGNTATLTPSAVSAAYQAQVGRYVARVTTAGAAGTQRYTLYDPDGRQVATALRSGVASTNGHITLTITATGSNAVVGDEVYFDVYPSKWAKAAAGATNGTQRAAGVLVNDVENDTAAATDIAGQVFTQGEFDWNVVDDATGDGHGFTLEAVGAYLREKGLVLLETREQLTDPYL